MCVCVYICMHVCVSVPAILYYIRTYNFRLVLNALNIYTGMHVSHMIRTVHDIMHNIFSIHIYLPRFGAKATSCTGSYTIPTMLWIFCHFLLYRERNAVCETLYHECIVYKQYIYFAILYTVI